MLSKRPARSSDYNFLYDLHKAALKEPISQTWGWDERNPRAIKLYKRLGFEIVDSEECNYKMQFASRKATD